MARVKMLVRLLLSMIGWGIPALALGQTPMPPPTLSNTDAIRFALASGMQFQDGKLVNRCGRASNPKISFVDLNDDGNAEALVADVDPGCYRAPGAWFAIVARNDRGRWIQLIGEDGIVGFTPDRTRGWVNLVLAPGDSACPGTRRFNGRTYPAQPACRATAPPAVATTPSAPANNPVAPAAPALTSADDSLPLKRGYYVSTKASCRTASNATLFLLTRDSLNSSRDVCSFAKVDKLDAATWRIRSTCSGDAPSGTETWTISGPTAVTIQSGDSSVALRHCPQTTLPEPWRSNDIRALIR